MVVAVRVMRVMDFVEVVDLPVLRPVDMLLVVMLDNQLTMRVHVIVIVMVDILLLMSVHKVLLQVGVVLAEEM